MTPTATATPTLTATPDPNAAATPTATLTVSALAAPALTAQAGSGRVALTWDAVASAVRYELWGWWDAETGWQRLDGGSLTGTTFTHSGLATGTTYYYTIRAVAASGAAGAWSEYASATLSALPAPALTAQAQAGAGRVALTWGAVANAVRYELWGWWDAGTGWQRLDDGGLTGTTFTHSGLATGATYYYAVRAVDANGAAGAWSENASATLSALPAPGLTAQAGAGRVALTWNAVANAVRYELWGWWDAETGWQRLDDGSLTGTTFTHTGLETGATYYYTVRAVAASGAAGAWSENASAVAGVAQH